MHYWFFLEVSEDAPQVKFWLSLVKNNAKNQAYSLREVVAKGEGEPNNIKKNSAVIFVLPANQVLLTEIKWPANLAIEKRTLIFALEDKIISDPEDVEVEILHQENNVLEVAVINKTLLKKIAEIAKKLQLPNYQITTESLLPPIADNQWTLWKSTSGLAFRYGKYQGMNLPAGAQKIGIELKLAEAIKNNRAPSAIRLCEYSANREFYQNIDIPIKTIEDNDLALNYLDINHIIPLKFQKNSWRGSFYFLKNNFAGIAKPIFAIVFVLIVAFVWHYLKISREAQIARDKINSNFAKVFPADAHKTTNPAAQIENLYNQLSGDNNYSFIAAMALLSKNLKGAEYAPLSINWQNQILTVEFSQPPNIVSKSENGMIINVEGYRLTISNVNILSKR